MTGKDRFEKEAKNCLRRVIADKERKNVEGDIACVREYLVLAELTPEDIGTSQEKLESYLKEGYFSEAKMWLAALRRRAGVASVKMEAHSVVKFIGLAGKTLADLHISKEELESLLSKTMD